MKKNEVLSENGARITEKMVQAALQKNTEVLRELGYEAGLSPEEEILHHPVAEGEQSNEKLHLSRFF